jgi:hypothetical protein
MSRNAALKSAIDANQVRDSASWLLDSPTALCIVFHDT